MSGFFQVNCNRRKEKVNNLSISRATKGARKGKYKVKGDNSFYTQQRAVKGFHLSRCSL